MYCFLMSNVVSRKVISFVDTKAALPVTWRGLMLLIQKFGNMSVACQAIPTSKVFPKHRAGSVGMSRQDVSLRNSMQAEWSWSSMLETMTFNQIKWWWQRGLWKRVVDWNCTICATRLCTMNVLGWHTFRSSLAGRGTQTNLTEWRPLSTMWLRLWLLCKRMGHSFGHLKSLATLIGSNNMETWFQLWETSTDSEELAKMIWNYVALLLTKRAGSLAKFGSPPECWALALSELHGQRQAAVTQMKLDWNRFVAVEKSDAGGARDLASDLRSTLDGPTRLMCLYYLFDGRSPNSAGGTTVLHALLDCFPDSKIVEDCHQALRKATDAKANEQLAGTSVQQVLEQSSVFSQREIHYASIDRQTFLDWWSKTKDTFRPRKEFRPRNDLPEEFSQILAKKTWATHSEPELVKSGGAWEWIRHYATRQLGQGGTRLQAGSFNLASEIEIDTWAGSRLNWINNHVTR